MIQDSDLALRQGYDALRAGDAGAAKARLEQVVAARPRDLNGWYGLAVANLALGDHDAKVAALDRLLTLDRRNMRALIMKGDHYADQGDERAASAFYAEALAAAPPQLPPDLMREAQRAHARQQQYAQKFEASLRRAVAEVGFDPERSSGRFARSLDILTGKREPFLQQPKVFYFSELPHVQFYEREAFPWFEALEARTDDIRAELLKVMQDDAAFAPYVEAEKDRPGGGDYHGMLGNADWSSFYLWRDGEPVQENLARCPATAEAMAQVPLCRTGNTPSVLFSMLKPGARIPPHHGMVNTRLICHLPLIVPPGCGLRVGNDSREWVEGRAWAFDDTIEHEAWNTSDQTRVILLFDVWRPELTEEERALLTQMFAAIQNHGGAQAWGT